MNNLGSGYAAYILKIKSENVFDLIFFMVLQDPEPPEPWQGVKSALKEGNVCTHVDVITGMKKGSEDCLFLNVFTPGLPSDGVPSEGKAVLVWIHGGGFQLGSGNAEIYGPDFFLNEDVILVTLNYRLGVLGKL